MPFPPTFTNVWDVSTPPDTQLANLLGQDNRDLKVDTMQRLSLLSGTLANRPTPETVNANWGGVGYGITYFATDTGQLFQWNGAAWVDVSPAGPKNFRAVGIGTDNNIPNTIIQTVTIPSNSLALGFLGSSFTIDSMFDITNAAGSAAIQVLFNGTILFSVTPAVSLAQSLKFHAIGCVNGAGSVRILPTFTLSPGNVSQPTDWVTIGGLVFANPINIDAKVGAGAAPFSYSNQMLQVTINK